MYQDIIDHTRGARGERHAVMTAAIIKTLQDHGFPEDVVLTGALYHLAQISHDHIPGLERNDINDVIWGRINKLRCTGLSRKGWDKNIRRFYHHIRDNIQGDPVLEAVQLAASAARVRAYSCTPRYGRGISLLSAELLYVYRLSDCPLRRDVHDAIREKADQIGFKRIDIEARAFQIQGYVFCLYEELYHGNPNPSKRITLPQSWVRYIDIPETPVDWSQIKDAPPTLFAPANPSTL